MRLIDADALIEDIKTFWDWDSIDGITATTVLKQTMTDISHAPTIDAEPVRHGRWTHERLSSTSGGSYTVIRCSECLSQFPLFEAKYCPNCGAKMEGGTV